MVVSAFNVTSLPILQSKQMCQLIFVITVLECTDKEILVFGGSRSFHFRPKRKLRPNLNVF
jgi:hypothetical protein